KRLLFRAVSEAPQNPGLTAVATSAGSRKLAVLAPAKINLFLHVGEKRRDKYHALESLVVFAEVGDRLEFAPANELTLKLVGPFAAQTPRGEDNLVLKAARALRSTSSKLPGAAITMEKNLPVAAGLGGGSADAAAVLRGLALFWHTGLSEAQLVEIA